MALILKDRVKEFTLTTGTGAISLEGSSETFDSFQSYMSNGDTTYYAIATTVSSTDEWEVGIGTWNTGNTLTRTTVLAGSNGTSAVDFSAGKKDIFMTYPADKAIFEDVSGGVDINGGTIDGTTIGVTSATTGKFTTLETTSNVDISGQLDVSDWIDLAAQASHPAHGEGRLWYDSVHKTLNYYSDDSGVVHELGIEEHARVYNETGSTISKGTPVHFVSSKSSNGTHVPTIAAANATSSTKYKSEGMVAADIANNSYGYIITAGRLEGLDTSHLSVGQFFTGITDGATQTAAPVYPNFPMCLGFVVKSDATNGVVFLAQQNHSIKSFRVQMDQHIGGSLTIDGDLNVTGSTNTTSTSDVTAGAPFYRANEGDAIGDANTTFTGSGLDDAFFAGHFTGTASTNYYVKIDGVGTPDTFAVSTDNFSTTISTGNAITGSEQMIHSADNISVKFGTTTGHTLNDVWTGTASPINVDTGFFSNRNTGTSGVGYTHMGLFYDVSDSKWRLVDEYDPVPAGTIDTGHSSYSAGTIAANLEGNVTGDITGNVSGNAATASALETARNIGGVSFDGTANINLPGVNASGNQDTTGNAATATALATARTIQLTGDVTGSATFDGSANASITAVVQDDSHAHVISNVDGLQTALDAKTNTSRQLLAGDGLTGGGDLTANRTFAVGAGTGITVNANNVAIDSSYTGFDGRYVNTAGDTMTGNLILDGTTARIYDTDTFPLVQVNSSKAYFGSTNRATTTLASSSTITHTRGSNTYQIFTDNYHPNADKWTDARTLSLSGDASGSVSWDGSANATLSVTVDDDSHNHVWGNIDGGSVNGWGGLRHSTANGYIDFGPANTSWAHIYTDRANFYFNKELFVNNMRVFNTGYHPNADKWTDARTITLAGDATGSVSLDGSANVTLTAAVVNDSHTHDTRYIQEGGTDFSGTYPVYFRTAARQAYSNSGITYTGSTDTLNVSGNINTRTANNTTHTNTLYFGINNGNTAGTSNEVGSGITWKPDYTGYTKRSAGILQIGEGNYFRSGLAFYTNDTTNETTDWSERMRISKEGNVGIGVAEPTQKLEVSGNINVSGDYVYIGPNSNSQYLYLGGSGGSAGTNTAAIAVTNGNLHMDSATTDSMYLNYYKGNGVAFGGGSSNVVAWMGSDGDLWKGSSDNSGSKYWHAGNDGSSSGLDADLLDGVQGSSYLRSDADDTFSGNLTLSKDGQDVLNFSANDTNDSRGISFNNRTALSADYNDGWLRINQLSEFSNGIYTPGALRVDGTLTIADSIQHLADTNTYMQFYANDGWRVVTNGSPRLTITNTTATFSGNITSGTVNGRNVATDGTKLDTIATNANVGLPLSGGTMTGSINLNNNGLTGCSSITAINDTNTYIQFHAADQFRVVTGGSERLEVTSSLITSTVTIRAPRFEENSTYYADFGNTGDSIRVAGDIVAYYSSDKRLKTNIKPIENATDKVTKLGGYTFNWSEEAKDKDTEKTEVGLIAQEVKEVMPELVHEKDNGYLAVDYPKMVALLVESIKELKEEINELKRDI